MNSITIRKSFLNLSLCLITAFALASCASSNSRDVAAEHKDDVSKIQDGGQAPVKFHSKRFENYNEKY